MTSNKVFRTHLANDTRFNVVHSDDAMMHEVTYVMHEPLTHSVA